MLQKIAIGTAESVMTAFCHSGRNDRNATAAATEMNVISDFSPAHASATFSVRVTPPSPAMWIFVPERTASTPVARNVFVAADAASSWSGIATQL